MDREQMRVIGQQYAESDRAAYRSKCEARRNRKNVEKRTDTGWVVDTAHKSVNAAKRACRNILTYTV
jgi:hypothetical protein